MTIAEKCIKMLVRYSLIFQLTDQRASFFLGLPRLRGVSLVAINVGMDAPRSRRSACSSLALSSRYSRIWLLMNSH